jgi:hypothetical protein
MDGLEQDAPATRKKRLLRSTIHDPFFLFAFIRIYSRLKTLSTQYLFFFATFATWR